MNENQDLLDLLGKINQLVDYGRFGIEELNEVQEFCKKKITDIGSWGFIEREQIDISNFKIYDQRNPVQEISKEEAKKMMDEYDALIGENKYRKTLDITRPVADDLFNSNSEVKIFLGEKDQGLIFLYEEKGIYYIIDNRMRKEEISLSLFKSYQKNYNDLLRSRLDQYIQTYDSTTINTIRFTILSNFHPTINLHALKYPNVSIAFYPAIHMSDEPVQIEINGVPTEVSYKHRLTFIMILKYYNGKDILPIENIGVFDRNGLCPPGC
jgi:hypothetical protein